MPGDMKAKIADTLNEILKHKELDKITVKELVDACNISRQSFYYHFQDIMEVVEWYQDQALKQSIEKAWRPLRIRRQSRELFTKPFSTES